MDVQDILRGIQPIPGDVTAVRTVQETRPPEEFADAYAAEVNLKCASKVIKALDKAYPRDASQPLNHLRRFAKHEHLSPTLQSTLLKADPSSTQTIFVLIPPPLPDVASLKDLLTPFAPPGSDITLTTLRVPLYAPLNSAQADKWTKSLWPVLFNPAAPRGFVAPPPQILTRARDSIQPKAGRYLALAYEVAREAEQSGLGRGVGAVVVDPEIDARLDDEIIDDDEGDDKRWSDAVVAVAGDARYSRLEGSTGPNPSRLMYNADVEGGPELHALMRVVDLIAGKRRADDHDDTSASPPLRPLEAHFLSQSDTTFSSTSNPTHQTTSTSTSTPETDPDTPTNPEKFQKTESGAIPVPSTSVPTPTSTSTTAPPETNPRIRSRTQGGYLCTDLDVYLTHEPCLCCSMGLLLSRFRAVIFPRGGRMRTGGLASEPCIGPVAVADSGEGGDNEGGEGEDKGDVGSGKEEGNENERLYYGLHWRKELNWRALGFEFVEAIAGADGNGESVQFHA
ncbi:hypothetical protein P168DRAFT_271743 [Aspergillus campestris IBT 28561]|uniref:Cytidine deaminase-like protein n=1 Tax=Aspergillus campestris (strain IBT 28561) TaxID=1392248 RepID=A0A2I1CXW2_ASPC2|nr:uncharacterized protein P168DRAFT_271743 [Aspergillus campestris IBT 28561]PKY02475.1 hypothetical protein P168DRAFT_271743 [Aspergillus campestris IBT 28561]